MTTAVGTGTGSAENATAAAEEAVGAALDRLAGRDPDFAVVFSSSVYDYRAVVDAVRSATGDATLIGSSSAGEFTERDSGFETVTVALVASDEMRFHVGLGEGLREDIEGAVERAAADLPDPDEGFPYRTGINLHDGLVGRGEEIAMLGYQQYPMPYTGGSAADDLELEETVVFADDRVESDAVALAMIESKEPFGHAVGHGHDRLSEGHEVTAAEGSTVAELDGRPAYEVWKDAVRDTVADVYGVDVDELRPEDDAFSELLTRFEFGIKTGDGEYKIRWPGLTTDTDGPLEFATKIPEGTQLYVMDSDEDDQIETAERVGRAAADGQGDIAGVLAFDCICQAAILGEDFPDAVEALATELDAPLAGMQTYGEIAMQEGDMRAYHNTTSSLLVFPE